MGRTQGDCTTQIHTTARPTLDILFLNKNAASQQKETGARGFLTCSSFLECNFNQLNVFNKINHQNIVSLANIKFD